MVKGARVASVRKALSYLDILKTTAGESRLLVLNLSKPGDLPLTPLFYECAWVLKSLGEGFPPGAIDD